MDPEDVADGIQVVVELGHLYPVPVAFFLGIVIGFCFFLLIEIGINSQVKNIKPGRHLK